MQRKGVHHLGLSTLDIDRTIDFYTSKLGWKVAWCDVLEPPDGGRIRHAFLDTGDGTLVAFMCPEKVPGIPQEFKTDINSAQNLPPAFYHFAFDADSVEDLEHKRAELEAKGVDVTPVVDHEWCRSIYFNDPNGLLLEYCFTVREFNEDDKIMKHRVQPGPMVSNPADAKKVFAKLMGRPTAPKAQAV
ncbi:MAG: VOC family protein [Candidatus Binataceae bacterium]|jgi:catechol 2,3-dioxygenase-like lactoylglutathione lyase family enzyme